MIQTFEQRHAPGGRLCPAFGGSSSSATSSDTYNTDMRVVGGADSTNISAQNSSLNLITTDHGAVKAGMDLGSKAIDANTQTTAVALDTGVSMFNGALSAVKQANENLSLAYQSGQAGDQTSLKYVGFIVVGLAAVALLGKK